MARYHVYRLKTGSALIIDLQADLLDDLKSRVVAPLILVEIGGKAMRRLTPSLVVEGQSYYVATHLLSAMPLSDIGDLVFDATRHSDAIAAAIDMVFQGF